MTTPDATQSKRCLHCHGPCGLEPRRTETEADSAFRARWLRWQSSVCSEFCWVNQQCDRCGVPLAPESLDAVPPGDPNVLRGRGVCSKRCFEIAYWHELVPAVRASLEADVATGEVQAATPELVMRIARAQLGIAIPWPREWEPPKGPVRKSVVG